LPDPYRFLRHLSLFTTPLPLIRGANAKPLQSKGKWVPPTFQNLNARLLFSMKSPNPNRHRGCQSPRLRERWPEGNDQALKANRDFPFEHLLKCLPRHHSHWNGRLNNERVAVSLECSLDNLFSTVPLRNATSNTYKIGIPTRSRPWKLSNLHSGLSGPIEALN